MKHRAIHTQRGAALLTAMIIVTLVASLAAAMVWRQYRAVQIEAAERARAQSGWILQGAIDWARLILREDKRANRRQTEETDHLGEVWAVPLAEARLSTFLAADKNASEDDGPEAFLSGTIEDAQARYNLRNLLAGAEAVDPKEKRTLEQLCDGAGAPPGTASLIITKMRGAFAPEPDKATAALRPRNVDQLAWFGVTPEAIERLRPLVILLPTPEPTTVNVNTASREVLAAMFEGMDLASAERIVQARQNNPFKTVDTLKQYLPSPGKFENDKGRVSVKSDFFIVGGKLRLEDRILEERTLVQRRDLDVTVLQRQRISQMTTTR